MEVNLRTFLNLGLTPNVDTMAKKRILVFSGNITAIAQPTDSRIRTLLSLLVRSTLTFLKYAANNVDNTIIVDKMCNFYLSTCPDGIIYEND